jgi:predicted dehydrogenase
VEQKIGFAVVGMGYIGQRHASLLAQLPAAELIALVEPDANRRAHAATQFGVPVLPSIADLWTHPLRARIQVVTICTPNNLHTDQACQVLAEGCHVVIEKPMGLTKAGCEAVVQQALANSRYAFVVMQNRYTPTAQWLRELLREGRLGRILTVQVTCLWNRDARYYAHTDWKGKRTQDGGTLFTQFSHFIDIMYWLFGDIRNISARFANYTHGALTEIEDTGVAQFEFVNGGMGSLVFSTSVWDTNQESSITIVGEKGSVKVGGQYMNSVEYAHIADYTMPELPPANPPNDYGPYKGSAANHQYIFQNVLDTLSGKAQPSTSALEGMKVVEMIERIYQAGQ